MAGGRPTEYGPKTVEHTQEYIDLCIDSYARAARTRKGEIIPVVKLPTIEGLAYYLAVSRDTIYEWAKEHKEFSDILEQLRALQADKLINNGLSGFYNSTIAKVLLTKHGYREGHEHTGADGDKLFDDKEAKEKAARAVGSFLDQGNTISG